MPDISMCLSVNCDKKDTCYRARAKPDRFQSWSNFEEFCKKDNYKYYIGAIGNNVLAVK